MKKKTKAAALDPVTYLEMQNDLSDEDDGLDEYRDKEIEHFKKHKSEEAIRMARAAVQQASKALAPKEDGMSEKTKASTVQALLRAANVLEQKAAQKRAKVKAVHAGKVPPALLKQAKDDVEKELLYYFASAGQDGLFLSDVLSHADTGEHGALKNIDIKKAGAAVQSMVQRRLLKRVGSEPKYKLGAGGAMNIDKREDVFAARKDAGALASKLATLMEDLGDVTDKEVGKRLKKALDTAGDLADQLVSLSHSFE